MLDHTMDRMEYVEGRQKVKDQYAKDTTAVLIEDSSSGTAIISDLRTTGIPILPISPAGSDKEANARAISPMFEAGMILLPEDADWTDDYVESMTRFPKGQHDDDVDSTSQALNYLRRRQHGVMEYIERELAKENDGWARSGRSPCCSRASCACRPRHSRISRWRISCIARIKTQPPLVGCVPCHKIMRVRFIKQLFASARTRLTLPRAVSSIARS